MTHVSEQQAMIGRRGRYQVLTGFSVDVTILDVREAFGRTDYLLEPVAGSGKRWAAASGVALEPAAEEQL